MTHRIKVRPVFPADFEAVLPLLQRLDPTRRAPRWRPLFEFRWRKPEDPVGYAAFVADTAVGFVGLISSEREIDGRMERFCNISSWITDDSFRGVGALLVLPLLRLRDETITSMTSNPAASRVLERLGLVTLDDRWTVLRPSWRSVLAPADSRVRIVTDPAAIARVVSPADARIVEDHRDLGLQLLAQTDDGYCLLIYSTRVRWRLRAAHLHYVSDLAVFRRALPRIQRSLMLRHAALLLEADARLLPADQFDHATTKRILGSRLFRSARLRPEQIPSIYTELLLLDLL